MTSHPYFCKSAFSYTSSILCDVTNIRTQASRTLPLPLSFFFSISEFPPSPHLYRMQQSSGFPFAPLCIHLPRWGALLLLSWQMAVGKVIIYSWRMLLGDFPPPNSLALNLAHRNAHVLGAAAASFATLRHRSTLGTPCCLGCCLAEMFCIRNLLPFPKMYFTLEECCKVGKKPLQVLNLRSH